MSVVLRIVPRTATVIHLRERPPLPVQQWTDEDWEWFDRSTFGEKVSNVVPIRWPAGRRSSSSEIREVMLADIRRGSR